MRQDTFPDPAENAVRAQGHKNITDEPGPDDNGVTNITTVGIHCERPAEINETIINC